MFFISPSGISNQHVINVEETDHIVEPQADADCSNFRTLANGEHYPAKFLHERVLGNIDVKVTRNMTEYER